MLTATVLVACALAWAGPVREASAGTPSQATVTVKKRMYPANLPYWKAYFRLSPDPDGPGGQDQQFVADETETQYTWTVNATGAPYTLAEEQVYPNAPVTTPGAMECTKNDTITSIDTDGDASDQSATFIPDEGDEIVCEIANESTRYATVQLTKRTEGDAGGPFHLEVRGPCDPYPWAPDTYCTDTGGALWNDDDISTPAPKVSVPGAVHVVDFEQFQADELWFMVTEPDDQLPPGWGRLPNLLSCRVTHAGDLPNDPQTLTISDNHTPLHLMPGDKATCTVINQTARITVHKEVKPADLPEWAAWFRIIPAPFDAGYLEDFVSCDRDDPTDPCLDEVSWNVVPGVTYRIVEADWSKDYGLEPAGPLTCSVGELVEVDENVWVWEVTPEVGDDISCSVTNVGNPGVSVRKHTPLQDGGPFNFVVRNADPVCLDGDPDTGTWCETWEFGLTTVDGQSPVNDYILPPGKITVEETTSADGFVPSFMRCEVTPSVGQPELITDLTPPLKITLQLDKGDFAFCDTENIPSADVTVTKVVEPAGFPGDWSAQFSISPVPAGEKSLKVVTKAEPSTMWKNLRPGVTYVVREENVPPGFVPGELVCTGVETPPGYPEQATVAEPGRAAFTAFPLNHVQCTQTNESPAIVTVQKTTVGGFGGPFRFVVNNDEGQQRVTQFGVVDITTSSAGVLTPASPEQVYVDAGFVKVAETSMPPHWKAGQMTCTLYDAAGQPVTELSDSAGPLEIGTQLSAGQQLACRATNLKLAKVTVTKTAIGDVPWSFEMAISPVPTGQPETRKVTNQTPTVTWEDLDPDTVYTVSESANPLYVVTGGMECSGATGSAPTPETDAYSDAFQVSSGDDVTCTIENTALDELPATGSDTSGLAAIGACLLGVGALLTGLVRRRTGTHTVS